MSKTKPPDLAQEDPGALPNWVASGLLGIVLGAGGMYLWTHDLGPRPMRNAAPAPDAPPMGAAMTGFAAPAMPPLMGNPKRRLTSFVGKLELLSRPKLDLHVELDQDQSAKIAAELLKLDAAETLTVDEAQDQLAALDALLTPEQRSILDAISMPRPGGNIAMAPIPEVSPDENPFLEQIHQDRLRDLIDRLAPAAE